MSASLRDQLEANLDKITTVEAPEDTPAAPTEETTATAQSETPTVHESTVGAETRARDEAGRFAKKDDKTATAPAKPGTPTPPLATGSQAQAAAPAPTPKPAPQRPSSWKKDYWGHWDKLTGGQQLAPEEARALAEYMNQREADFQHGVAAYKREWDNAKPVMEAIAPFMPILQQNGIQPNVWIANLGAAHRELALGSPQQKLQRFQWLAQQYGVPLNAFADESARTHYLQSAPAPAQAQALTVEQAKEIARQEYAAIQNHTDVERFLTEKKEKHPYIVDQEFRNTMAQILEAGLAPDLQGAHDLALQHPRHSEIRERLQQQEAAAKAEAERAAQTAKVMQAKAKAVSPRTVTPTAQSAQTPKDRRSQLEENFNEVMGGARV